VSDAHEDDALFVALLEAAPEPPLDFVPGTAAPPAVAELAHARRNEAAPRGTEASTSSARASAGRAPGGGPTGAPASAPEPLTFDPTLDTTTLEGQRAQAAALESLARQQPTAQAAARHLIVASELWALAGDLARAAACAREAVDAAPSFTPAHVQLRSLHLPKLEHSPSRGLWIECLQHEARFNADAAGRAHAALLLADSLRLTGDVASAGGADDLAKRSLPKDLRAPLSELVERLAAGGNPLAARLEAPLRGAALRVAEFRTGRESPEASACLLLERARRHLAGKRPERAAEALLALSELDVDAGPLLDVAAALAAHNGTARPLALRALRRRLQGGASRPLLRTLAARALEQGDKSALQEALEAADPASGTFDFAERVVLSLLGGGDLDLSALDLEALGEPALALALEEEPSTWGGGDEARWAALGAALRPARSEELALLLEPFDQRSSLRAVFAAELAAAAGDADQVVSALHALAESVERAELFELVGWLQEAAQRPDRAADAYLRAHELAPQARLVRALGDVSASAPVGALLAELARAEQDESRAGLLWLEAALRGHPQEAEELLEQAARNPELSGCLPLLGAFLATRAGDPPLRERWLSLAHAQAKTPFERGLALLRAATGDGVPLAQVDELGELVRLSPGDRALAEHAERLQGASAAERARNRLRASSSSPEEEAWLGAEALWLAWQADDQELASAASRQLLQVRPSPLAQAFAESLAEDGGDSTEFNQRLLQEARDSATPERRAEALERLAEFDEARGDRSGAVEWRRALLTEQPGHLRTLIRLERDLLAEGRVEQLLPIANALASELPPEAARSYELWLGARHLLSGDFRAARRILEPLARGARPPALAVTGVEIHAQQVQDDDALLWVGEAWFRSAQGASDACASALQPAFAALRLRRRAESLAWTDRALGARPEDLTAHWLRAELLEGAGVPALAAAAIERLAPRLAHAAHRLAAWLRAAELWLLPEAGPDPTRAEAAFRELLGLEPGHRAAFEHLRRLVTHRGDHESLVQLLRARLALPSGGDDADEGNGPGRDGVRERCELLRALAESQHALVRPADERAALEQWLELEPNASEGWRAHAEVCTRLEDYTRAESSWLQFLECDPDATGRSHAWYALALLYDEQLGAPKSAAECYERVLGERPGDLDVLSRLVTTYATLGEAAPAIERQTRYIQLAPTPQEKRDGALLLAELYERLARDVQRAAATLERTRKAWPHDPAPLAAVARFMERQGEGSASRLLVERTGKEVWRKLETERIEPTLLDLLATVAELQGHEELARCARAAHRSWLGEDGELEGAGVRALDRRLDDLLAPPELSPPLRALLRKTGRAFDVAFPIDPGALGARRMAAGFPGPGTQAEGRGDEPWTEIQNDVQELSRAGGLGEVELFVTPSLGARCLPGRASLGPDVPQQILVGPKLAQLERNERKFLLVRAFKLQQSGAGALARSRSEDTWPMLAALLHLFAPNWTPAGVDREKFLLARTQLERGLRQAGYDDDVPFLVLEAIGTLTQRATHLGEAARLLPNRVGLLATGSLSAAWGAFARLADKPLAEHGPARWRWLNGHAEARDLALFCASSAHAQARTHLGLAVEPPHAPSQVHGRPPRPPQRSLPGVAGSLPPRPPRRH
jgi:hypothetical protein